MRKILSIVFVCAALLTGGRAMAQGVITRTGIDNPEKWINTYFAQGKVPPFSFAYEEISSGKFITDWRFSKKKVSSAKGVVAYTATWTEPNGVLRVTCDIKGYADAGAVEWTLKFKNLSRYNTSKVAVVRVADYKVSEDNASGFTARWANGYNDNRDDFVPNETDLRAGVLMEFAPEKGLSSTGTTLPYFNIESRGADAGVVMAIGWTGCWNARLTGVTSLEYRMFAGLEKANFYLKPGEEVRTPLVATIFWKGSDYACGQNALRRFIVKHHSPRVNGSLWAPTVGGFDFGNPAPCEGSACLSEDLAMAAVKRYKQLHIFPEVLLMEKGWYSTPGDWSFGEDLFPDGLGRLSGLIHSYGGKLMLSIDLENINKNSQLAKDHPDFMLLGGKKYQYIFDFSQPKAVDWLCKYIGDMMEREGVDGLLCDFEGDLAHFWDLADGVDRAGLVEMKYVAGLYRFWDYILKRFPGCALDCSASMARLDLEVVSRSAIVGRGRALTPELAQCQNYALNQYFPLQCSVATGADAYDARSRFGGLLSMDFSLFGRGLSGEQMQDRFKEYHEIKNCLLGDYYPLIGLVAQRHEDRWIAEQFHDRASGSGIVVAFRRSLAENVTFAAGLKGIDPEAVYELYDCDAGTRTTVSGSELIKGCRIRLDEPHSSILLRYKRK